MGQKKKRPRAAEQTHVRACDCKACREHPEQVEFVSTMEEISLALIDAIEEADPELHRHGHARIAAAIGVAAQQSVMFNVPKHAFYAYAHDLYEFWSKRQAQINEYGPSVGQG